LHFTERVIEPSETGYENGKPQHLFGIPRGTGHQHLPGWDKYAHYLDKDVSPLLGMLTRTQFEVLWLEMVKGNGTFLEPGQLRNSQLYCSRKAQADSLQAMATLRGFAVSSYERETDNGVPMYCLTIRDEQWIDFRPGRMVEAKEPLVIEESAIISPERVWCVNNRLGTLVTRRRGKVAILGNCIPTRYKAGTDLDAMAGDVSIMELDIQPHAVTEFAMLSVT
jgi:hypothetical protein